MRSLSEHIQLVADKRQPTTTFNGQADTVTLVANQASNQSARIGATWLYQGNHRAGRLAADV